MKIEVPLEKMDKFLEKLEKLNKMSATPFELKIKDPIEVTYEGQLRQVFPVEVIGEPYKLEGDYRILGTLRPSIIEGNDKNKPSENIVVDLNEKFKIPEDYRNTDICECEHCGIKRERLIAFIVAKIDREKTEASNQEEYSNYMQVGSVCVKNFTDGRDVKDIIKYFDLYNKLLDVSDDGVERNSGLTRLVRVEDYIHDYLKAKSLAPKAAIKSIDKIASNNFSPYAESFHWYEEMRDRVQKESTSIDKLKAKSIIDYIKFSTDKDDNDIFSSKVLFKQNYIFMHQTLPLQRVIENLLGEEQKLKREQELAEKNLLKGKQSHLGTIHERGEFILRLESVRLSTSFYGDQYIHNFRDQNNNAVVSFFKGVLFKDEDEQKKNIENKTYFKMAGRVEKHGEYLDEKQTIMSRIKFVSYDLEPTVKEEKKRKVKQVI